MLNTTNRTKTLKSEEVRNSKLAFHALVILTLHCAKDHAVEILPAICQEWMSIK